MKLFLSIHSSPRNSTYTLEDDQAIYKTNTPLKLSKRVTTISRVVPNSIASGDHTAIDDLQNRFGHLAEIEWQTVGPSKLKFGGNEIETDAYFTKSGLGAYGRHRTFTAPDGRNYKWKLKMWAPELYLKDGSKALVAKYHRAPINLSGPPKPAYLEIFPEGEPILDVILLTFVYVETIRKDRERASR